ncbi:flagella accessory protein C [Halovenus halobia]|uniref:flagella accessory protein C n=1 Tax=Halovenus halobia TaxID=3396622 RepID=UPI003F5635B0
MSGSDDLGGLGELDDGGEDLGDLDDGGDDLGGLDDGFDDMEGGDEMAGGGGGNVDELEHRLDELENEVGSLSSTVNTVRNENEQISNSVEEVEENVRKLLDIYEMVTRGVNPFADEMGGGGMGGGQMDAQDSSFGLFADDEEQEEESVDEDIADADAEGFFDDDLVEEDESDEFGEIDEETADGLDDADEFEAEVEETEEFDDGLDESEEFDDDFDEASEFDEAGEEFEEMGGDFDDGLEETEETPTADGDEMGDEMGDEQLLAEDTASSEPDDQQVSRADDGAPSQSKTQSGSSTSETEESTAGKPYLREVPGGITGDLVVVEWLEYLVDEVGARGASEAIQYYETIDWVTETVATELEAHLGQFEHGHQGSLSTEHHRQSLAYIDQLRGGEDTQASIFGGGDSL